jgi:hypothetical protein
MKAFNSRILIAGALIACAAVAAAQGGGGQGRGGFRQGGRGGGNNELTLAMRSDVQTDLGVTADQKTKLEELRTKLRPQRGQGGGNRGNGGAGAAGSGGAGAGTGGGVAAGGGAGAGGNGGGQRGNVDPAEMRKRQAEQRAATHKALGEVLSADQMKRLGEISIQLQGNRAVGNEDVQKALGITDEQKTKITDLQTKMGDANRALFEKVRNQEISQEDMQKSMQNNTKTLNDELGKILTPAQATKLKDMQGKPFKADPNITNGRGGGGGGL